MLKTIRLFSQTAIFALATSATYAQGIDLIKYAAEPEILSDPYRPGLTGLGGPYVGIRTGTTTAAPMTVFNAHTGEILAGDIFDPEEPRVIEYSTQTGWAVVIDDTGALKLMNPSDSNAGTLEIEPGRTIKLLQFVGEDRDMLLVISAEGPENSDISRTIKAINVSDLQVAWEKSYDEVTTLVVSEDRNRLIAATYQEDEISVDSFQTFAIETGDPYPKTDVTELDLLTTNSIQNFTKHSPSARLSFIYSSVLHPNGTFLYVLNNDTGAYVQHTYGSPLFTNVDESVYIAYNAGSVAEVRSTETGAVHYTLPSDIEGLPFFSYDGESVFYYQTGSTTISEVDYETGDTIGSYSAPEGIDSISRYFSSSDGSALAIVSANGKLVVFNLDDDSTEVVDLPFSSTASAGFSNDSESILIPNASGQIVSFPVSDPASYITLAKGRVEIIKYSESNDSLLTVRGGGNIHFVSPETPESTLAATIPLGSNEVIIDVSADSLRTIVFRQNRNIEVYDPTDDSVIYQSNLSLSTESVYRGAISPDGNCLAYSFKRSTGANTSETHLIIYDLQADALTLELTTASLDFDAFIFAPDSQTLYLAGQTSITFVDPIDGSIGATIDSLPENAVFNISPDSGTLVVASAGSLQSFSASDGSITKTISFDSDSAAEPTAVALSHDNSIALVISGDNLSTIIDLQTEEIIGEKQVFWAQSDSYYDSATPAPVFLPDSRSFVSYYFGGAATKWDFKIAAGLSSQLAEGSSETMLNLSSEEGPIYAVERSTDLVQWESYLDSDPFSEEGSTSIEVPAPATSLDSLFFRVWTYE